MNRILALFRKFKWEVMIPFAEKYMPWAAGSLRRFGLWRLNPLVRFFRRRKKNENIYKSYALLRQTTHSIAEALGPEAVDKWYVYCIEKWPWIEQTMNRAMYSGLSGRFANHSLKYGEKLLSAEDPDLKFIRNLSTRYHVQGQLKRALEVERIYAGKTGDWQNAKMLEGKYNLLTKGFPLPERNSEAFEPIWNRTFYLLHNSLPFASGGYATRSHGLAMSLRNHDWDVNAVTRLGFPCDVEKLKAKQAPEVSEIDGITYRRLPTEKYGYPVTPADQYLARYLEATSRLAAELRPAIIHGASNYVNGIVATAVAQRYGIKSVYEVRGLWEVTRGSRQPEWHESEVYLQIANMERDACLRADKVITITGALRDEMVRRGVPEEKISIIPNGVDSERFKPIPRDDQLAGELGIRESETVIGFVGSMVQYEGLDYLLEAVRRLCESGVDNIRLLMVGDGAEFENLVELVDEYELGDKVIFTGRVPHEQVERMYSLIHIAPFPRKGQLVCEMVSPLKPFEAMAMEKAVISSDVAALAEIVDDENTGLLHGKDDVDDLAACLKRLIDSPELRKTLGKNAREWVVRERDWRILGERVGDIYASLVETDR